VVSLDPWAKSRPKRNLTASGKKAIENRRRPSGALVLGDELIPNPKLWCSSYSTPRTCRRCFRRRAATSPKRQGARISTGRTFGSCCERRRGTQDDERLWQTGLQIAQRSTHRTETSPATPIDGPPCLRVRRVPLVASNEREGMGNPQMTDDDFCDRVDAWHKSGSTQPLHEYLGMTLDECAIAVTGEPMHVEIHSPSILRRGTRTHEPTPAENKAAFAEWAIEQYRVRVKNGEPG
jgi:hypothetical protein